MKASPALAHYVYDFLENKAYSKGKGDFARKVSSPLHWFSLQIYIYTLFLMKENKCLCFETRKFY